MNNKADVEAVLARGWPLPPISQWHTLPVLYGQLCYNHHVSDVLLQTNVSTIIESK